MLNLTRCYCGNKIVGKQFQFHHIGSSSHLCLDCHQCLLHLQFVHLIHISLDVPRQQRQEVTSDSYSLVSH
jgi:5-methylcytosine-specific restriction endonuclease McrA